MKRLLLPLCLLLSPIIAQAQAPAESGGGITTGLHQPGASSAITEGPASLSTHPAGMLFSPGLRLRYLHEAEGDVGVGGNGLFASWRPFSSLSIGAGFEWLDQAAAERRTTWALALGGRALSLGVAAHLFTDGPLDDETTFDVGLIYRPGPRLSVALQVRDLGGDEVFGGELPRRWVVGLGLRPFDETLTLGVDYEIPEGGERFDTGFDSGVLSYTARLRVLAGLQLFGQFAHRVDGDAATSGQVGLALDFGHLGLEGTPVFYGDDLGTGAIFAAELRSSAEEGLLSRRARVELLDLDRAFDTGRGLRLFPSEPRDALVEVVEKIRRLERDPAVEALVLRMESLPGIGAGEASELRAAILRFRDSGKPVYVHLLGADDTVYRVASAADEIFAAQEASFFVNGFASHVQFYEKTLALLGIDVQAVKVGRYKNAPDVFTRSSIDDDHREVIESLLDDLADRYVEEVSASRTLSQAEFREALETGIQSPQLAKRLGLVDQLIYEDELETVVGRQLGGRVRLHETSLSPGRDARWGEPRRIAIVPIDGLITGGRSGSHFFGVATGAESVKQALEHAADDPRIGAIVLRIDSGGGDAAGSQRIWRAVEQAARKKPIFAAMGDSAASGGYFAAAGTQRIFATPDTLTGSIGIFWIKPSLEGLFERLLDVGTYSSKRGDLADISSVDTPWSEQALEAMQQYVDDAYADFVLAVAEGRGLPFERVDELAQGRVWTGAQAKERGLVDDLGGLAGALRAAREAAGFSEDEPIDYRVLRPSDALLSIDGGLSLASRPAPLPEPLSAALRTLPMPFLLPNASGLWALSPYRLQIR